MIDDERQHYDQLMKKIAQRDQTALGYLYEELKTSVFGLSLSITCNTSDAADITHDVFIRVWTNAKGYRKGTDAKAWILKIAKNMALKLYHKNLRFTDMESIETLYNPFDNTRNLDHIFLVSLLKTLKSQERRIVILYSICDYSHKEIAKILGIPYATERWKYSNALKKLSNMIGDEYND